jgi:glutathione S-transferase
VLRLYDYAASANCYKARLLLAQVGRDYERVPIDIFDGETLTPEFARLNPRREVPVLELDNGRVLVESNAILWYLGAGTPFLPAEPAEQAEVVRWLIYEQSDVMPMIGGLRFRLITGRIEPGGAEALRRTTGANLALALLDGHLSAHEFLAAGRYTIADSSVYAYSHVAGEAGIDTSAYPAFCAWLGRVEAQPGFMNDLQPYPANASMLAGRSIYG